LIYNEQKTVELGNMAEQEHIDIIKQGRDAWDKWKKKHHEVEPDLSNATLIKIKLSHADLSGANFRGATLRGADLSHTDLSHADFSFANLSGAILSGAELSFANLSHADLSFATLRGADIIEADLSFATLRGATIAWTVFGNIDLRQTKGLETIYHGGPSIIGMDTLVQSEGNIPETFLRGVGTPDTLIEYALSLVANPIEYYTCFISYSSKDQDFAERLYADLQNKGVRCWYAPEDMKIGDKIRPRIDESIRLYDKLLLVLSEHSICSQWVEHEVEMALAKERTKKQTVLFPVRLDKAIIEMNQNGWPSEVRHTRHIGDFERWKDHDSYQKSFQRLLRDLQAKDKPKNE
jgi:hypothetical protein